MKRLYKAIVWLLAAVLLMMPLPVLAAGATATVGTATASPGETVTIPVSITGMENIAGMDLHIAYDSTRLECVSAQAAGLAADMDMASVNTKVAGHADEIWLTALSISGVSGSGEILTMTFRVLDTAAEGMAAVTILEKEDQLATEDLKYVDLALVDGGITVTANGSKPSGDTATTTASDGAEEANPTTTAPLTPMTKPDGEELPIPDREPAKDIAGNELTDENGEPLYVQGVAITVDHVEADPGDTVAVQVAISPAEDLTAVALQIGYDPDGLEYAGGMTCGGLDSMAWSTVSEDKGIVSIGAMDTVGADVSGVIAVLHFTVRDDASAKDYRLSVKSSSEMQAGDIHVPLYPYSGEIRVMTESRNLTTPLIVVGALVAATVAVGILAVLSRKKKHKA